MMYLLHLYPLQLCTSIFTVQDSISRPSISSLRHGWNRISSHHQSQRFHGLHQTESYREMMRQQRWQVWQCDPIWSSDIWRQYLDRTLFKNILTTRAASRTASTQIRSGKNSEAQLKTTCWWMSIAWSCTIELAQTAGSLWLPKIWRFGLCHACPTKTHHLYFRKPCPTRQNFVWLNMIEGSSPSPVILERMRTCSTVVGLKAWTTWVLDGSRKSTRQRCRPYLFPTVATPQLPNLAEFSNDPHFCCC